MKTSTRYSKVRAKNRSLMTSEGSFPIGDQGRFAIGYYHQRFGSKKDAPEDVKRQDAWFEGMESAFLTFGGVPAEVLSADGARSWLRS